MDMYILLLKETLLTINKQTNLIKTNLTLFLFSTALAENCNKFEFKMLKYLMK